MQIPAPPKPWLAYFWAVLGTLSITAGAVPKFLAILTKFLPLLAVPALPWVLVGIGSLLILFAICRLIFQYMLRSAIDNFLDYRKGISIPTWASIRFCDKNFLILNSNGTRYTPNL